MKAPKVKFKYKKSKYFKVSLKHKSTKKPMSGIKLKLKIYTGKKYKEYELSLYYDDIPVAALSVDKHFSVGSTRLL